VVHLINKFNFYLILLIFIVSPFFYYAPNRIEVTAINSDDLPKHIHLTFQNSPSSTITVTWQTDASTTGDVVLYDLISRGGDSSLYQNQEIGSTHTYDGASGFIHDVELTGLVPDSIYFFICGGPENYSEERSFKTAPNILSDFKFVVGGDSRSFPDDRTVVSQAMSPTNPSFVLHNGDMVVSGEFQSYWDTWFTDVNDNWVGDNGLTIPIIPSLGNHENNSTNYYEQFALPNNEQWYYYDWGPSLRIIVLNSESFLSQITVDQVNWLEKVLDTTPWYMWKIVVFHRNVYYSGGHQNATDIIQSWVPVFDKYHVDIVFQGHSHLYHRTKPMKNNTSVSSHDEGTMYVTSAGWGAPSYTFFEQSYSASGNNTLHFTLINVYKNGTLHLEAKDVTGYTFDEVRLNKDVLNYNGISILTNSTIPGFILNQSMKKINFNVSDVANIIGFFNVTIPKQLLGGPYTVRLDNSLITTTLTENATHSFIYTTYTFPSSQNTLVNHTIDIVGTIVYSNISCATSSDNITTNDDTTIFGSINPAVSAEVTIQINANGDVAWNNLETVIAASDGSYSYLWNQSSAGTYDLRATWSGNSAYYGATSPIKTLTVKNPTTITCQLSKVSTTITNNVTISGIVNPTRSGVPITIYYKNNDVWVLLKAVISASDGSYSYTWTPTIIGSYQFKSTWVGDSSFGGATSSEVPLSVSKSSTTLSCSISSSEVTKGASVTVSGAISSETSDPTVTLTYQKPDGSTITRTVTASSDGNYSDSYVPDVEGSWGVTASWNGDSTHDGSSSSLISFTVKMSGCLIATATYGSELSPQVQFLRSFRDNTVTNTFAGSSFMNVFNSFYYSFSPTAASVIANNSPLRTVMKGILYPLIGILHVSSAAFSIFHVFPELGVVISGILASSLIGIVYFLPIILLLFFIKKFQVSSKIIRLTGYILVGTFILLVIAEVTKLSLMMMVTTGAFVLFTMLFVTLTSLKSITERLC
jgi:predicted phosphodiesterase